jgi:hypothetical protein
MFKLFRQLQGLGVLLWDYPRPVTWLAGIVVCICLLSCSEQKQFPKIFELTPKAETSIARADAHRESAQANIAAAKPDTGTTGKARLAAADDSLNKQKTELEKAQETIERISIEARSLNDAKLAAERELALIKSQWGYRLQAFVHRCWVWIKLYLLAYTVLSVVSLFIPGPFGSILAVISHAMNPFGWLGAIRDNVWFRKMAKK